MASYHLVCDGTVNSNSNNISKIIKVTIVIITIVQYNIINGPNSLVKLVTYGLRYMCTFISVLYIHTYVSIHVYEMRANAAPGAGGVVQLLLFVCVRI